jgi:hypothetical protein
MHQEGKTICGQGWVLERQGWEGGRRVECRNGTTFRLCIMIGMIFQYTRDGAWIRTGLKGKWLDVVGMRGSE